DFHMELHCSEEFQLTAPTGVVASDIGGSTIHSEATLRVTHSRIKADTMGGQKICTALEKSFAPLKTLVVH
ncbi:hypothetical protein C8J55DRAFT_419986, partial [Lentinula edodes]